MHFEGKLLAFSLQKALYLWNARNLPQKIHQRSCTNTYTHTNSLALYSSCMHRIPYGYFDFNLASVDRNIIFRKFRVTSCLIAIVCLCVCVCALCTIPTSNATHSSQPSRLIWSNTQCVAVIKMEYSLLLLMMLLTVHIHWVETGGRVVGLQCSTPLESFASAKRCGYSSFRCNTYSTQLSILIFDFLPERLFRLNILLFYVCE